MSKLKMKISDEEENKLFKFAKEQIKDESIDITVDKAAQIAHISMPVDMLQIMIFLFKKFEKELENTGAMEIER
jgi:hypothetical protein